MAEVPERIVYAREPRRLPVVLSADEVVRFLEAVPSLKARAALTTAYAAGRARQRRSVARRSQLEPELLQYAMGTTTCSHWLLFQTPHDRW